MLDLIKLDYKRAIEVYEKFIKGKKTYPSDVYKNKFEYMIALGALDEEFHHQVEYLKFADDQEFHDQLEKIFVDLWQEADNMRNSLFKGRMSQRDKRMAYAQGYCFGAYLARYIHMVFACEEYIVYRDGSIICRMKDRQTAERFMDGLEHESEQIGSEEDAALFLYHVGERLIDYDCSNSITEMHDKGDEIISMMDDDDDGDLPSIIKYILLNKISFDKSSKSSD